MNTTVSKKDWPAEKDWPKDGWKHALNYQRFSVGSVFAWHEDGHHWSGIVEETQTCSVKVKDVLPCVISG